MFIINGQRGFLNMVELKNDIMRRATLDNASKEAHLDNYDYAMHRTMNEQRALHDKRTNHKAALQLNECTKKEEE